MKHVIVLQGVSGSGKSTYARKLAEKARVARQRVAIVSADRYFERSGTYTFDPLKLSEAHGQCFRYFIEELGLGTDLIVVDNTNTTAVEMAPYMLAASAYQYTAEVQRVVCDPAVAAARNLHGVPATTVVRMAGSLASDVLPPWWAFSKVVV